MIGAILGDIIGSRFEFHPRRANKSEEFELFTDECHFTDDTVMTIATADAIMNNKSFTEAYQQWGNKYPDVGYGGKFKNWLVSKDPKPYGSYGNGSAMRVSPVAWLFNSGSEINFAAYKSAMVTHNHEEGTKAAEVIATCIFYTHRKMNKNEIKSYIQTYYGYDLNRTIAEIKPDYKFEVSCQKSVPEAIICFLEGNSYEDVVRKAVSLGGDTDTQACIAGSIAEAYYGIPASIALKIHDYLPDEMLDIVEQFNKKIGR